MSRLGELIRTLCPDGVEYIQISELCELRNGYTPSKAVGEYWEDGTIPWFRMEDIRQNGRILSDSIQHITPQAVKGGKLFPANSIILATTATIGEHALITVDALSNQRFTNLNIRKAFSHRISIKFFYYYMFVVDEWCKNNINVSGFACVDMAKFKKVLIPVPPMEVQEEIVRILDKFTQLEAELEAELEARKKQYEHYRDTLLEFTPPVSDKTVIFKRLGDVCDMIRGVRVTKRDLIPNGKYPVVSGGTGYMGYINDYNREATTITIAQYGTAGYVKWQEQRFWANDVCFSVLPNEEIVINKYLYYVLSNKQEYLYSISNREAVPYSIDREKILNIEIPIPPIEEQERIVNILDKFEAFCTDLCEGLPAEIEARRRQYEHYRDRLLSFRRKSA